MIRQFVTFKVSCSYGRLKFIAKFMKVTEQPRVCACAYVFGLSRCQGVEVCGPRKLEPVDYF